MAGKKIAFLELEEWEKDYVLEQLRGHDIIFIDQPLSKGNIGKLKDREIIASFIFSKFTPEFISRLPKLKLIATMSTGYDHIDLDSCSRKKITVSNVPHYGENTVAEHTFALLLSIAKKLKDTFERSSEQVFDYNGLRGFDLAGKRIGIIGTGSIGKCVIRIARGFDMEVIAHDPFPDPSAARALGFVYVGLDELLKKSDIISLHVPLLPGTSHILNERAFSYMKKGVVIINTSRGGLIDTKALIDNLENRKIAAAGLDVLEDENFVKEERAMFTKNFDRNRAMLYVMNHILYKFSNVVITPHNAFNTKEALQRILETTIDNILSYVSGKPDNLVIKRGHGIPAASAKPRLGFLRKPRDVQ